MELWIPHRAGYSPSCIEEKIYAADAKFRWSRHCLRLVFAAWNHLVVFDAARISLFLRFPDRAIHQQMWTVIAVAAMVCSPLIGFRRRWDEIKARQNKSYGSCYSRARETNSLGVFEMRFPQAFNLQCLWEKKMYRGKGGSCRPLNC